jgi:hypothetical protein
MNVMKGKNIRRISTAVCVVFACVSLLLSQSLVEIAKKEKERRAALKAKGKTSIVVTNADLKKQTRLSIIAVESQDSSSQNRVQARQRPAPPPSTRSTSQQEAIEQNLARDVYGYRKNATKVIFSTGPVANPEFALDKPDAQFAEISEMGVLDLEFSAINGPGTDIAIYAHLLSHQEIPAGENEEGGQPLRVMEVAPQEGFWYGVLAMNDSGEWQEIGKGRGMNSPDEFDLGELKDVNKIRIMFKPHNNPGVAAKLNRLSDGEHNVGIDAIEALH